MKLTGKNYPTFLGVLFLCLFIGTLVWEIIMRLVGANGAFNSLSIGPYGFDLGVVSLWVRANPGTLAGLPCAFLIFRSL